MLRHLCPPPLPPSQVEYQPVAAVQQLEQRAAPRACLPRIIPDYMEQAGAQQQQAEEALPRSAPVGVSGRPVLRPPLYISRQDGDPGSSAPSASSSGGHQAGGPAAWQAWAGGVCCVLAAGACAVLAGTNHGHDDLMTTTCKPRRQQAPCTLHL
jgi:hypothetical protein